MTPLLTEGEAAELLNLSERTIRKARQSGRLPYVQLGRSVRYRVEDVSDFISRCTVANDPSMTRNSHLRRKDAAGIVSFTARDGG